MSSADKFAASKYLVLRGLLPRSTTEKLLNHVMKVSADSGFTSGDEQVPGTPAVYADPAMEHLLERLGPIVESTTGILVYPTYSYYRVYKKGDCLKKHRDREACEISLSLSLGYEPNEAYPFWLDAGLGAQEILMEPGDAVLYRGIEVLHWRNEFTGDYAAQVFLHYVDRHGPHKEYKYDKREALRLGAIKA